MSLTLTEPVANDQQDQRIRTTLNIASSSTALAVSSRCQVITGRHTFARSGNIDLACPRIVRDIVDSREWTTGQSGVPN